MEKQEDCNKYQEINKAIAQLYTNLQDLIPENRSLDNYFYLYKWLIQNQMKVEKTESLIRKSMEWRRTVNLEELAEREIAFYAPGLEKQVAFQLEGFTKTGNRVTTIYAEGLNLRGLVASYGRENLLRFFFQLLAKLERSMLQHYKSEVPESEKECHVSSSESEFKPEPQYDPSWETSGPINILSFKDFSLLSATSIEGIHVFVEGSKIAMSLFPALVQTVYFVNLNTFSNLVLKTIRPIISSKTMTLEFYDTDTSKWSKVMLELIDADQLSIHFGGTAVFNE